MKISKKNHSIIFFLRETGNYLSSLIMPNLSIFIAWGLINFLANFANGKFYMLLSGTEDILINFLLPFLIGYTGGKKIDSNRGGAIAGIATLGVMVANDNSAVLGAMIIGPLAVILFKKLNTAIESKIKVGYQMLFQNILGAFIGTVFCLIGIIVLTPLINTITKIAVASVYFLIAHHLLPLVNIIIEPLKIFFFNNAINHGVMTPLGLNMVRDSGRSILFLLEVNPGPGLGILLAYAFYGNDEEKKQGAGASMIHLFGGIHEVYFPFVLKEPKLFFVTILSGVIGTTIFQLFDIGLAAPVSPGSIILILMNAPRSSLLWILLGIFVSTLVSFFLSVVILRKKNKDVYMSEVKGDENQMIRDIVVACDAGIGSSAMGASLLKRELKRLGYELQVENKSIYEVENDAHSLILVHSQLKQQLKDMAPQVQILEIDNFLDISKNVDLIQDYLGAKINDNVSDISTSKRNTNQLEVILLFENNIRGSQTMASELMRVKASQLEVDLLTKKEPLETVIYDNSCFYIISEELEQSHHVSDQTEHVLVMSDFFNMTEFENWLKEVAR